MLSLLNPSSQNHPIELYKSFGLYTIVIVIKRRNLVLFVCNRKGIFTTGRRKKNRDIIICIEESFRMDENVISNQEKLALEPLSLRLLFCSCANGDTRSLYLQGSILTKSMLDLIYTFPIS